MRTILAMIAMIALLLVSSPRSAIALPLTVFRYEDQAQRHCPADTVVWLDFAKRIYYSKGQRHYGHGDKGSYVCRDEARGSGYRRSVMGFR